MRRRGQLMLGKLVLDTGNLVYIALVLLFLLFVLMKIKDGFTR